MDVVALQAAKADAAKRYSPAQGTSPTLVAAGATWTDTRKPTVPIGPGCLVWQSAATLPIASGSYSPIRFDREEYDHGQYHFTGGAAGDGAGNVTDNRRLFIREDGYYVVKLGVELAYNVNLTAVGAAIYLNGLAGTGVRQPGHSLVPPQMNASFSNRIEIVTPPLALLFGDFLNPCAFQSNSAAANVNVQGGTLAQTWCSIERVG